MSSIKIDKKKYNSKRPFRARKALCHAPFSNINFTQNGDMLACCYNHTEILGTYPKQSIKEAWEGKVANELRMFMKKDELGSGCQACQEQIGAGNFAGSKAVYYDKYASLGNLFSTKIRPPKVFEFEISNTCNLECVMCTGYFSSAIRANREKLPKINSPYDDAFIEDVKNYIPHLSDAKFLGGEPFLISQYFEIWDSIISINPSVHVHITTNGTVLNKRAKNCLEKMQAGIIISVDSLNKENYEQIRVNGDFDVLMENIRWFIDYRNRKGLYLSFAVCPMISNRKYLADVIQFCNENDIYIHFNTVWKPHEECLLNTSINNLTQLISDISQIKYNNTAIQRVNKERVSDFLAHLKSWQDQQLKQKGNTISLTNAIKENTDKIRNTMPLVSSSLLIEISTHYEKLHQQERLVSDAVNQLEKRLNEMGDEMGDETFRKAWQDAILFAAKLFFEEEDFLKVKLHVELVPELSQSYNIHEVNRMIVKDFDLIETLYSLRDSSPSELKEKLRPK